MITKEEVKELLELIDANFDNAMEDRFSAWPPVFSTSRQQKEEDKQLQFPILEA